MSKQEREVLYPTKEVRILEGKQALTPAQAKEILGWIIPEKDKSFEEYFFKDSNGRTVHLENIELQRPYYKSQVENLKWEILQGQWQMNMENIIIGETGLVLEGKHRLTALVSASEELERNPERYPFWSDQKEPTIEVTIAFGAKEDPKVVNTMGTGKPRSLGDSLYAAGLFDGTTKKEQKVLTKMLDFAIRILWDRTGTRADAYNPRASHSDAFNFLERHPGVIESVRHVFGEEGGSERRLSKFLGLGHLAGLCYMASASNTEPHKYHQAEELSEEFIDFSASDSAEEFLVLLSGRDKSMNLLIKEFVKMNEAGNTLVTDKVALLVKAYGLFLSGKKLTPSLIALDYKVDDDGISYLTESPTLGGIDLGPA